jgi:hypothetical protein
LSNENSLKQHDEHLIDVKKQSDRLAAIGLSTRVSSGFNCGWNVKNERATGDGRHRTMSIRREDADRISRRHVKRDIRYATSRSLGKTHVQPASGRRE